MVSGLVVIGTVFALNVVAFFHARAMTSFTKSGPTTKKPEELSITEKVGVLLRGVDISRPANVLTPSDFDLPYSVHSIATSDGVTLEAWVLPIEDPVATAVVCHGYADSKDSVLPVAKAFRELGCRVVIADFRGSGGSSGATTTVGHAEAEDVAATLRFARETTPGAPILAYGVSMGGAAILRSASTLDLDADGLVIESTFDTLVNAVKNRFTTLGLPAAGLAELLVFWGGVQRGFNGFAHNPVAYARSVTRPTLVFNGSADPRVRPGQARGVYDALGGWKRFAEFHADDHVSLVAVDPTLWTSEVKLLLEQVAEPEGAQRGTQKK